MKNLLSLLIVLTLSLNSQAALARDLSVFFAESYQDEQKQPIMQVLGEILMPALEPGDNVTIFAGAQELDSASIPNDAAHSAVARFRSEALMPAWAAASSYMHTSPSSSSASGHFDLPAVLERLQYGSSLERHVLIFGSPMLSDQSAPQWSMQDGWPNDAVFGLTRAESPYGTADAPPLGGTVVHFCVVTDDRYADLTHERMVERSIALLVEGYGADLATFSNDLSLCVRRAVNGETGGPQYQRDPSVRTPQMLTSAKTLTFAKALADDQLTMLAEMSDDQVTQKAMADVLALRSDIRLIKVWLSDSRDEDQDLVSVLAPGLSFETELTHEEMEVVVPVIDGTIAIKAIVDGGGGGVTLSVRTEDNVVHSPILAIGEIFEVSVATR